MRKVLTILLSIMMVTTIATTSVFADGGEDSASHSGTIENDSGSFSGQSPIDVTANVSKSSGETDGKKIYNVGISWKVVPADYTSDGDVYTWNPTELKYVKTVTSPLVTSSSGTNVEITIKNRSNAPIKYNIAYASDTTFKTVSSTYSGKISGKIESAEPTDDLGIAANSASGNVGGEKETTYKAYVNFGANDTMSASGTPTMGTYTVKVKNAPLEPYNVKVDYAFNYAETTFKYYEFDGEQLKELTADTSKQSQGDGTGEGYFNLTVNEDYLIVAITCGPDENGSYADSVTGCTKLILKNCPEELRTEVGKLSVDKCAVFELDGNGNIKVESKS